MGKLEDGRIKEIYDNLKADYDRQSDPRYAAARLWIDEIIDPRNTRKIIIESLDVVSCQGLIKNPRYGALQV